MPNIRYTKGKATPLKKVLQQLQDSEHAPEPEDHHQPEIAYRAANRCPKDAHWYKPGQFRPWNINQDKHYKKTTASVREVYAYMCRRSRPTKKKPTRRYISISIAEITRDLELSPITVRRSITILLSLFLLKRWHRGYPGSGSSRYEIPASLAQIRLWRIPVKKRWRKNQ
ncbi:MAG TPA: hypothetical protein ENH82_10890 [bacterium]|nr:hypothetical protein [bacterium]